MKDPKTLFVTFDALYKPANLHQFKKDNTYEVLMNASSGKSKNLYLQHGIANKNVIEYVNSERNNGTPVVIIDVCPNSVVERERRNYVNAILHAPIQYITVSRLEDVKEFIEMFRVVRKMKPEDVYFLNTEAIKGTEYRTMSLNRSGMIERQWLN